MHNVIVCAKWYTSYMVLTSMSKPHHIQFDNHKWFHGPCTKLTQSETEIIVARAALDNYVVEYHVYTSMHKLAYSLNDINVIHLFILLVCIT